MSQTNILLDKIGEYYSESYYVQLTNNIVKEIEEKLTVFLNKYSEKTSLSYTNSAYSGKYFKISSRIKKEESLKEKLIRNDDYLFLKKSLINFNGINLNEDHKNQLDTYFDKINDLTGIKILGDLNCDVEEIFEIIKNHKDDLKNFNIEVKSELDFQPVEMKNNLKIFKLNCEYSSSGNHPKIYPFELQIKSQLLSAWGDMEHQQFYKNYEISPIKTSIQTIMNDIAHLLLSVEKLFLSVRKSDQEYKLREAVENILSILNERYSNDISENLNRPYAYNFSAVTNLIYEYLNFIGYDDIKKDMFLKRKYSKQIHYNDSNLETDNTELKNLNNLSEISYDLKILIVVLNDLFSDYNKFKKLLDKILNKYKEYIVFKFIQNEDEEYFNEVLKEKLSIMNAISTILKRSNDPGVFLLSSKYKQWGFFSKNIEDIIRENDNLKENEKEFYIYCLSSIFGLTLFSKNQNPSINIESYKVETSTADIELVLEILDAFSSQFSTSTDKKIFKVNKLVSTIKSNLVEEENR